MNKKVLLVLLLFIPFIINAKECDEKKHNEYVGLAPNITYDNNYSKSTSKFNIVVYNIFEGMYIKYNKKTYEPDSNNSVTINDIKQGTSLLLYVYADDGCDEIKIISLIEPYFNQYYGTSDCTGYEGLRLCSSQFTDAPVQKEVLELAKKDYQKSHQTIPKEKEPEKKKGILDIIKEYIQKWGIKVLLVVVTVFVASSLFNAKFRKIKHGI